MRKPAGLVKQLTFRKTFLRWHPFRNLRPNVFCAGINCLPFATRLRGKVACGYATRIGSYSDTSRNTYDFLGIQTKEQRAERE